MEATLAGYHLAFRRDDNRVQESDFGNAGGELVNIAEFTAMPLAHQNRQNGASRCHGPARPFSRASGPARTARRAIKPLPLALISSAAASPIERTRRQRIPRR